MSISFKKHILPILGLFVLIIFTTVTIFLIGRKVVNKDTAQTPDPEIEQQKYLDDTSVTTTFLGDLPCEGCEGIRLTLSVTKESAEDNDGTFTVSRVYFDSDRDAEYISGTWSMNEDASLILNPDENADEMILVNIDEETYELDGEEIMLLN